MTRGRRDGHRQRPDEARPVLEWMVGAASAILVAGLVLYLGYEAAFGGSRPADLAASVEKIDRRDGTTLVTIRVTNRGEQAAATVAVLATGPDPDASREIEFDYVAPGATSRGTLVFPGAPAIGEISVSIGGYTRP